ncbi:exosortase-associated EpsI family protein [Pelodictyon luteolum]|uniref:Methanolan biosynthesis EpsI domain-containing protein n=1 Tax=Chlorobium luteolum (strain DSM 273 / BCRC 81028 / 2530) TaxID=319225 RepID=Q3B330_CHLL3|nr:exosortase-associated EpsI family protein [Pelodictyon luteolum]ABB24251.1 hypothetical protein Plut_1392 [Pelodictyon luteolum DSM 273]
MNDRHNNTMLWALLAMAVLFGTAAEWHTPGVSTDRLAALRKNGSLFASRPLPFSPEETAFYGTVRVLKRFYQCWNGAFILIAIDGSANRHAVHDPLYCIKGAGWEITESRRLVVDGGTATLLSLTRKGQQREAVFWFSDGSSRHSSVLRYWLQTTLRRLTFGASGKEPVLLILQSIEHDRPDWQSLLERCLFLFEV